MTFRQRLRMAIHDPGAVVGKKLGPSWPADDPAHRDVEESVSDWMHRAALAVVRPELAPEYIYLVTWADGDMSADLVPDPDDRWPGNQHFTEKDHATRAGFYGYLRQEWALEQIGEAGGRTQEQARREIQYRRQRGGQEWVDALYDRNYPTGLEVHRVRLHRSTVLDPPGRPMRDGSTDAEQAPPVV